MRGSAIIQKGYLQIKYTGVGKTGDCVYIPTAENHLHEESEPPSRSQSRLHI